MPRRLILSATERETLMALPDNDDDLIRRYTLNDAGLAVNRQSAATRTAWDSPSRCATGSNVDWGRYDMHGRTPVIGA